MRIDVPAIEARIARYQRENAEQIMNAEARKLQWNTYIMAPIPSSFHGDLKPNNILLDENLTAHVSNFGLAKVVSNIYTAYEGSSSSVAIEGTLGCLSPGMKIVFFFKVPQKKRKILNFNICILCEYQLFEIGK